MAERAEREGKGPEEGRTDGPTDPDVQKDQD